MPQPDRLITAFTRTQRHLPHWEEPGATYFLCLNLARPARVELSAPAIGSMVVEAVRFYDGRHYDLYDYTVMPDHIHMIVRPRREGVGVEGLRYIMRNLKRWMTRRLGQLAPGQKLVWQDEVYDHIIRNQQDYEEKAEYIFRNPQTAGLTADPADWPWWGRGAGA